MNKDKAAAESLLREGIGKRAAFLGGKKLSELFK